MLGQMNNSKVDTHSLAMNSRPHECEADPLPHDHGHHTITILIIIYYCIKPTLPVRYKRILTEENRALTGENVYQSVNSRAVNDWLCMFNILDPGLPCKQCMLNVCPCQFQVLRPTRL